MIYCPYCGTKLHDTSWGNKYCPNCGIIGEDKSTGDEKDSYIG